MTTCRTLLLIAWVAVACSGERATSDLDVTPGDLPPGEARPVDDTAASDEGREAPSAEGAEWVADADVVTGKQCAADNSPGAVAARDGFLEVCADPSRYPDAVCGDGSPYRFSYRPAQGASQGLLLYFRGGGACNDYVSCWGIDGKGGAGRRVSTLENDVNTAPAVLPVLQSTLGIFFLAEPLNPLRAYDQVHIAYCTGDAGLRDDTEVLARPPEADADAPQSITTHFHGRDNLLFALDRARELFANPHAIVMFGSSAGSHAALSAVPMVDERWPDPQTPLAFYSEGGVGVGLETIDQAVLDTIAAFDGQGGRRLVRFAQFSFISDKTQRSFAPTAWQDPQAFQAGLKALLEARAAANPGNYRYFALPGTCHTLAQNVALFQQFTNASGSWKPVLPAVRPNPDLAEGGVALTDWLTALVTSPSFDASLANVAGDFATVATTCPVPGSD